jgi:hypothetical protein
MSFHRSRVSGAVLASVVLFTLVGCGSSTSKSSPSASDAATTTAVDDPPATTNAPPVDAVPNADGSVTIKVAVGTDDFDTTGGKRVVGVKKGANVTIELTDASVDQKYHLHDYEIEIETAKGATGTMTFIADKPGQHDLESHVTNKVILVIFVS